MTEGPHRAAIVRNEDAYRFVDFPTYRAARGARCGSRRHTHDGLSLFVYEADTAEIIEVLRLPGDAMAAMHRTAELRGNRRYRVVGGEAVVDRCGCA
jgi:hypothetical protein